MTDEREAEACPFCGSAQAHPVMSQYDGKNGWQVICLMCNASGSHSVEEKVAIARWNVIAKVYND